MGTDPDVLVVIWTWDRGACLKACVESMREDPGMEIRLWIADNGSARTNMWSKTSGLKQLQLLVEWHKAGLVETVILNDRNRGNHALNQLHALAGLTAAAPGVSLPDFVVQTVDDSIFHPGWLAECHQTLLDCESYPDGECLVVSPFHCRHSDGRAARRTKTIALYPVGDRTYEIKQCISGNTWFMRGGTWDLFAPYPTKRLKGGWDWASLEVIRELGGTCAVTPEEMVHQHPEAVGTGRWQRSRNWK